MIRRPAGRSNRLRASVTALERAAADAQTQADLLDAVDASVIATNRDGCVTHWNRGAERLFGWTALEAVGEPITSLMIGAMGTDAWNTLRQVAEATGAWEGQLEVHDRRGETFQVYVRTAVLRAGDTTPNGFVSVSVDISERLHSELRARSAESYLHAVADSMAEGLITLDGRQRVTYMNHAAADMLGWPRSEADYRQAELVSRASNGRVDRFSPAADTAPPELPTEGVEHVDDDTFMRRDGSFLPVSYNLSGFISSEGDAGSAVVFRDITPFKIEQARVRGQLDVLLWEGRIRDALAHDGFSLFAQPVIDIESRRVVQHELLLRMKGPGGNAIAPSEFLPAAERSDLIVQIDNWVLAEGFKLAAVGHAVGLNVSAASLGSAELFTYVKEQVALLQVDPTLVSFELTETALLEHERQAQEFVARVTELGCRVALDDFGTGYGGFTYLKRLPVHYLKIDREFVTDLSDNAASRHVVEAVVALARGFGQKTVAEGVETPEILPLLAEMGIDLAQGYAIGRPQTVAEAFREMETATSDAA